MSRSLTTTLWAAGSLKQPLSHLLPAQFRVALRFGPSGHLRDLIEGWARPDLFVSASAAHCDRLVAQGLAPWSRPFARNEMVILTRADGPDCPEALLHHRLAISTPGADPSGDYALEVFDRIEATMPGLGIALGRHAVRLMGHPAAPQAPEGQSPYALALTAGLTDAFLTYRSNAVIARAERPDLTWHELPAAVRVQASFALCPVGTPTAATLRLIDHLCSPAMAAHLAQFGFDGPDPA